MVVMFTFKSLGKQNECKEVGRGNFEILSTCDYHKNDIQLHFESKKTVVLIVA